MTRYLRKNPFFIIAIAILYLASSSSHPTSNGGYTGAPGDSVCAQCHTDNNPSFSGEIIIDGIPSTVTPGLPYSVTVTVTNTNLNVNRAGFQITALNSSNTKAGNFTESDPNASLKNSAGRQYFGHSPAVQFNGNGSISWEATWTAPTTGSGTITFYGASILGSGSNGNQDDKFLLTQFETTLSAGPLSVNITNVNNVSCYNGSNGTATAVPSGGNTPYQYNWTGGQTTASVNNLEAGLATVTVTDNGGTTATASVNITEPSEFFMTGNNAVDPDCFNSFNGSISVTVTGGTTPYFYDWSNGGSGATLNNLGPGAYSLTVTDDNNCTFVENFNLSAPPAIQINNSNIQNVSCFGGNNGSIQLTVSGGSGTLQYEWSNGANTKNLTNIPAGTYMITITDQNACALDETYTVTQPPVLNSNITVNSQIVYNGNNNGSLTASGSGGTSPYTFSWSNGANTATINNLNAATYNVTITDNKACTSSKSQTLNNPPVLNSTVSSTTNASCPGVNNGSASITINGGVSPYTTTWSNGSTGTTVNNFGPGSFTYTVSDNLGCTTTGTVNIGSNQAASLAENDVDQPTCFGSNNGSISITASNASGYNILWSSGQSGLTISNLSPGSYTVQASNLQGCVSNELEFEIIQPEAIVLAEQTVEDVSCNGAANGSIETIYEGGTGNLTYEWNTGQTTSFIDSLNVGFYALTVTDANACISTKNFLIFQPEKIVIDSTETQNLLCSNQNNGSISVFTSGGVGNLQAVWSNGDIGNFADSLSIGNVSVVITDIENCSIFDTFSLTAPASMNIEGTVSNESATNMNDGNISIIIVNGISPYQYLWSNGDTTSVIDSLSPGLYEVTVTDATGCQQYAQYNVQSGNCALAASHEVIDVSCFGESDGQVLFNISNGSEPYTITPQPINLNAGSYSFIITDTSNCSISVTNIEVNQPQILSIKLDTIINATGATKDDGEIRITITGGTNPYQYIWYDSLGNQIDSIEDVEELLPGEYQVEVTDANGCDIGSITFEVGFVSSNEDVIASNINIYPNPVLDVLFVECHNTNSILHLLDLNGRLVKSKLINEDITSIDVSELNQGLYLVRITNGKNITTKRISVE